MRWIAAAMVLAAMSPVSAQVTEGRVRVPLEVQVSTFDRIGDAAEAAGLITGYRVDGRGRLLMVSVGSFDVQDARDVIKKICDYALMEATPRVMGRYSEPLGPMADFDVWRVRAFLIIGERPAASCTVP